MPELQAITIDGTVIECDKFKAKKQGLELKKKEKGSEKTIGFVPLERLMFVIPEQVSYDVERLEEIPA